ncbi:MULTISPECIES: DUF6371 domain-containing protein [Myroides]|uniref:DUF6371 domain-containing protein n=1 Tax=Myroides TaxID=76831 RepID=UPI002576211B|nr:DUF6371 domain-containing protein [Myroides marinus]MDM1404495.1 hypothetical protein [Myroides marinus]
MTTNYRFILEKGSKKHYCPTCNKVRFVRYVDTEKGEYLPLPYGKCDRLVNCGADFNPYKDGYVKGMVKENPSLMSFKPQPINQNKKSYYIPVEVLNETLSGYSINTFIQNLLFKVRYPFTKEDVEKVIALYNLGTVQFGYRKQAITFPFIDVNNNIRAIQVKEFNELNHTKGTDFLHSIIEKQYLKSNKQLPDWLEKYLTNDIKVSCLFGEHLLNRYKDNPVALVEAPKTVIYCNLYFGLPESPKDLLWLAVYNLSSLNLEKCKALKGRKVFLFPDLSKDGKAFELWSNKAKMIMNAMKGTIFKVSDLLEKNANDSDKEQGKDLADYLITQDWRLFRNKQ